MSNEFEAYGGQDATVYVILKGSGSNRGKVWNGTTFVTYATADIASYDIALTELGTSSGQYQGDFPTAITSGGSYSWVAYQQAGGSPAEGDTVIGTGSEDWTGSASATSSSASSMTASDFADYVKRTFKRTDKDTELYEAITDAIQIMRRRFSFDEAQTDTTSTATISALGTYKIALESDMGLLLNVILQDTSIAFPLTKITKSEFDGIYADAALNIYRGYPSQYAVWGGNIYIGPVPDRTSYTYRLNYSKRAGTVTSSTTAVPFTDLYRDILKDCTLWKLNETLEKFDTATYYQGRFENGFEEATSRERLNRGEGSFIVSPFMS